MAGTLPSGGIYGFCLSVADQFRAPSQWLLVMIAGIAAGGVVTVVVQPSSSSYDHTMPRATAPDVSCRPTARKSECAGDSLHRPLQVRPNLRGYVRFETEAPPILCVRSIETCDEYLAQTGAKYSPKRNCTIHDLLAAPEEY